MKFTAKYGYVGLAVEQKEFVAEGLNEEGLSAGLFYFPNYGQYEAYKAEYKSSSIADLQLVSWVLGNCKTVDEVMESLKQVHVVAIDRVHRLYTGVLPMCQDVRWYWKS